MSDRIQKDKDKKLSGEILINNTLPLNQETFGKIGAYVMQDDRLYKVFTPREALRFAARLKTHSVSKEE